MTDARPRGRPVAADTVPDDGVLLGAALEAFAAQGFAGTSVREIARQVGVSHNLIPQRFGSKDRLWYAAVDHGFGSLLHEMLPVVLEDQTDDVNRLRSWMIRFVEANAARPSLLRIINQEAVSPGPRFDYLFDHYIEPVRLAGEVFLTDLYARGEVTTTAVDLVYFFMIHGAGGPTAFPALADRFAAAVAPDDPVAVRRHAIDAVDLLIEGLRARS